MRPSVGSFEEGRTDLKFEIAQAAAERRLSNPECYRGNRALDTGKIFVVILPKFVPRACQPR